YSAPPPRWRSIPTSSLSLGVCLSMILRRSSPSRPDCNRKSTKRSPRATRNNGVCLGMRFPGQWKNLGGLRVSPYAGDFVPKWLQIRAPVRITDRHGQAFETITAKAMKNATNVNETDLNWEWTTECGTAAYCAWHVGH